MGTNELNKHYACRRMDQQYQVVFPPNFEYERDFEISLQDPRNIRIRWNDEIIYQQVIHVNLLY